MKLAVLQENLKRGLAIVRRNNFWVSYEQINDQTAGNHDTADGCRAGRNTPALQPSDCAGG